MLSDLAGEFFCAKGSSRQQKELQLKSWHCSFDADETRNPHENTKEKGETVEVRRKKKWNKVPGRSSTDDPVGISLSTGATTFWAVFSFSEAEAKLVGRSWAGRCRSRWVLPDLTGGILRSSKDEDPRSWFPWALGMDSQVAWGQRRSLFSGRGYLKHLRWL